MVTPPLRGRFGAEFALDYYLPDTLALILARACTLAGQDVDPDAMKVLATNARGTPRTALMLLSRAFDYATTGDMQLTEDCARRSLSVWGVSKDGLERTDRAVLRALYRAGRPIGLVTLCAMLGEEPDVMLWGREPYLLRLGLIERTPQGRTLSSEGMLYYERYGRERQPVEVSE
jgi:Holliday junction DNA helicase RuvB